MEYDKSTTLLKIEIKKNSPSSITISLFQVVVWNKPENLNSEPKTKSTN